MIFKEAWTGYVSFAKEEKEAKALEHVLDLRDLVDAQSLFHFFTLLT